MRERKPGLRHWTPPVISFEDDVHAWMYLDQGDGVLRYEAYVLGYDDFGMPSTLEFVIEEGVFELSRFPEIKPFLPRRLRERLEASGETGAGAGGADGGPGAPGSTAVPFGKAGGEWPGSWSSVFGRGTVHAPWDLTKWQWEGLHGFFEREERRLKQECRSRWIRRLRALGYDVIRSL